MEMSLLETAWGIIANAGGGDWSKESTDWQGAAERWRDEYHKLLDHDRQLISEEWLRSTGPTESSDGVLQWKYVGFDHHCRHTQVSYIRGRWWANGLGCKQPRTHGDFYRLMAALGIPTKGGEA